MTTEAGSLGQETLTVWYSALNIKNHVMLILTGAAKSNKLEERINRAMIVLNEEPEEMAGDIHKKTPHRDKIHDTGVYESLTKGYDDCRYSL